MRRKIATTIIKIVMLSTISMCMLIQKTHAAEVSELREEKAVVQETMKSLKDKLIENMEKINETESELIELGEKMFQTEADLLKIETEIKEYEETISKTNTKTLYKNGNQSIFDTILNSESLVGLFKKAMNIKTAEEAQQEQLNSHLANQEKLVLMKAKLKQDADEIEEKQKDLLEEKEELEEMIENARSSVEDLNTQIQEAAAEATAQSRELNTILTNDEEVISKSNLGAVIVKAAYSQLGVSYRWGGTTPYKGLDCSGLTQYCHKVAGISVARTSSSQARGGKKIASIADALPGDLICYSGHVGIYIGNGQMIHAPQTGDVVKISSVYRSSRIIAIRRYW